MTTHIYVDPVKAREKIATLKEIQKTLESEFDIPAYAFGSASSVASTGVSPDAMKELNMEYDKIAKKLSELVGKTIAFLDGVILTFEETDRELYEGFRQQTSK